MVRPGDDNRVVFRLFTRTEDGFHHRFEGPWCDADHICDKAYTFLTGQSAVRKSIDEITVVTADWLTGTAGFWRDDTQVGSEYTLSSNTLQLSASLDLKWWVIRNISGDTNDTIYLPNVRTRADVLALMRLFNVPVPAN